MWNTSPSYWRYSRRKGLSPEYQRCVCQGTQDSLWHTVSFCLWISSGNCQERQGGDYSYWRDSSQPVGLLYASAYDNEFPHDRLQQKTLHGKTHGHIEAWRSEKFAFKGILMRDLVQALRSIGENNITAEDEKQISKLLAEILKRRQ